MAVFKVAGDNLLDRIQNARSLLNVIKANEANRIAAEETKIQKGLFFVVLYGAIERCMVDCVSICINHLNSLSLNIGDLRPELWALAFHPDFTRIEQNSNDKKIHHFGARAGFQHSIVKRPGPADAHHSE